MSSRLLSNSKMSTFFIIRGKRNWISTIFFLFFVYNNLGPRYFKKAQFHLYSIVKSKPIYATQVHRRQSMYTQVYFDDVQCWSHKNWIFIIALGCTKRKNCRPFHFCSKAPAWAKHLIFNSPLPCPPVPNISSTCPNNIHGLRPHAPPPSQSVTRNFLN